MVYPPQVVYSRMAYPGGDQLGKPQPPYFAPQGSAPQPVNFGFPVAFPGSASNNFVDNQTEEEQE